MKLQCIVSCVHCTEWELVGERVRTQCRGGGRSNPVLSPGGSGQYRCFVLSSSEKSLVSCKQISLPCSTSSPVRWWLVLFVLRLKTVYWQEFHVPCPVSLRYIHRGALFQFVFPKLIIAESKSLRRKQMSFDCLCFVNRRSSWENRRVDVLWTHFIVHWLWRFFFFPAIHR